MTARLLAVLAVLGVAPAAPAAGPLFVNGAGTPLVWTAEPIPFNPDRGPLGTLDNATAVEHVAADFGVWAAVPTAAIGFTNAGALPVDVTAANVASYLGQCGDGLSPIIFDTDGTITDDLFGTGASRTVLGFAAPECMTYVPPVITEGSAVLNGKWIDGVDSPSSPEIPVSAFDAVFIHEFGHYVNLDHSQVNLREAFDDDPSNDDAIATMFPILIDPGAAATLNLDDEVSVSMLYPGPSFATSFGRITGKILLSDGTSPFQGAYVIARKVGDPRISAVGMASGARFFPSNPGGPPDPSLEGRYELAGLPPGSYTVEIEAIDPTFTGGSSVGPLDPPAALLGPPEFWNAVAEGNTNPPDDPSEAVAIPVSAGVTTANIDIVLNAFTCSAVPGAGCRTPVVPGASSVQLKSLGDHRALAWRWGAGDATAKTDFGDPTRATAYQLCVYDTSAGTPHLVLSGSVPAGGTCAGRPCWKESNAGFSYSDRALTPDGISKLQLHAGDAGKARITLRGKGVNLRLPGLPLVQDPRVTVQLQSTDGRCWEATFGAPALVDDAERFKDVSD